MIEHIHVTVCARNNVTLRASTNDCMEWLSVCADEANSMLERKRERFTVAMTEMAVFGHTTLDF